MRSRKTSPNSVSKVCATVIRTFTGALAKTTVNSPSLIGNTFNLKYLPHSKCVLFALLLLRLSATPALLSVRTACQSTQVGMSIQSDFVLCLLQGGGDALDICVCSDIFEDALRDDHINIRACCPLLPCFLFTGGIVRGPDSVMHGSCGARDMLSFN